MLKFGWQVIEGFCEVEKNCIHRATLIKNTEPLVDKLEQLKPC